MSKKTYALITGLTSAICAAGVVLVTYFQPPYASAINGVLSIVEGAVAGSCALFLDQPTEEKKK